MEIDPRMIAEVQKLVQSTPLEKKLNIVHGDALKVELPFFDVMRFIYIIINNFALLVFYSNITFNSNICTI